MGRGETKSVRYRRPRACLSCLVLSLVFLALLSAPSSALASFGISEFSVSARNGDGTIDELAASHPFALDVDLGVNVDMSGHPEGTLHVATIDLPPGLVGAAQAVDRCSLAVFNAPGPRCPGSSQIGILQGRIQGLGPIEAPLYNLDPFPGEAAAFGVSVEGRSIVQHLTMVGSGAASTIRLTTVLPPEYAISNVEEQIWGVPADSRHDPERTCWTAEGDQVVGCAAGSAELPFLTLPASCIEPLESVLEVRSLEEPLSTLSATAVSRDAGGNPRPLVGCDAVPFNPGFTFQTDASALAPTGLAIGLLLPQTEGVGGTATAALQAVRLRLPDGIALNPSAGNWLVGCSPAEIGLETEPGVEPPVFGERPANCPLSSRLGSVMTRTPFVNHPLGGAIYLASPSANPFGARYAFYLVIEDEATGLNLKMPGRLEVDPEGGPLGISLIGLPQVSFSEMELEFAAGPEAPLVTPGRCGRYAAEATFTPSTAPFEAVASRAAQLTLEAAAGRPCPPPEAERNAVPRFHAGSEGPVAGGSSPFLIDLSREDADQQLGSFDFTLPPGLSADLGSVPLGAAVGAVQARAGVGPGPVQLNGTVYLEGPYRGTPFSLKSVVPAQLGPFDLGTIVQRAALEVDPVTAQITVHSDPLPQILDGVPLQLRGLRIDLDRPGFIRNPTSCEPMAITGTATTSLGQTAPISDRFQVGDCAALPFKPKAALRFSGSLRRNGHPAIRMVLRGNADEAAISSARFSMPAGELLDLQHVSSLCPQGTAADTCPAGSRLGQLSLTSPFLDGPAEGSVYLVRPSHRLPELLAEVRSGSLRFVLHGRTAIRKGHFSIVLPAIPDIPLSKAVLSLEGGRRGLMVNSRSLCAGLGTAEASLTAHSGKQRTLLVDPRIAHCKPSRHFA